MQYRRPRVASQTRSISPTRHQGSGYQTSGTGVWRHEYNTAITGIGSINPASFASVQLLRFVRSFGSAGQNDFPPSPTASNNFQSFNVFNGSRIENFEAKFNIKNISSTTAYDLDVYIIALSFYDALVWDTVLPSNSLVTFTSALGDPDNRGQVFIKSPTANLVTRNSFANYKINQHYMQKLGTIHLSPSDGTSGTAEFSLKELPMKVRRSQTGMFYAVIFANDSDVNNGSIFQGTGTAQVSFDEIPSENRLPYVY